MPVYIKTVRAAPVLEVLCHRVVNVLLGVAILGERLERPVRAAVGIAAAGVLWLALHVGQFPWIPLTLATSFGLYGLLRKLAAVGPLAGLTIETALLFPLTGGYLAGAVVSGRSAFLAGNPTLDACLLLGGPVTAVPLLFFAAAARRLPLSTMGFLQYLSPTFQFLLAVLAYGESFDRAHAVAFALIWTAVALFAARRARAAAPAPSVPGPAGP